MQEMIDYWALFNEITTNEDLSGENTGRDIRFDMVCAQFNYTSSCEEDDTETTDGLSVDEDADECNDLEDGEVAWPGP